MDLPKVSATRSLCCGAAIQFPVSALHSESLDWQLPRLSLQSLHAWHFLTLPSCPASQGRVTRICVVTAVTPPEDLLFPQPSCPPAGVQPSPLAFPHALFLETITAGYHLPRGFHVDLPTLSPAWFSAHTVYAGELRVASTMPLWDGHARRRHCLCPGLGKSFQ